MMDSSSWPVLSYVIILAGLFGLISECHDEIKLNRINHNPCLVIKVNVKYNV